jgi:RNA polymerase sigma-70 factor (ECF subfamily)
MKIWNYKDRIDITMSEKSYIYQAAKNTALDHIRKYKLNTEVSLDDQMNRLNQVEAGTMKDSNAFLLRTKIKEALNVLKPKTRKIFELHKFEGLAYEEIAYYMDISKRTVESNMARALILLRGELRKTLNNEN